MNWITEQAEVALGLLMTVTVTGVLVCAVAGVLWNRRHGFAPLRVPGPARGSAAHSRPEEQRREDVGPDPAGRHQRAARLLRRGERAENPETALLVCHWATKNYYNWQSPWAAWTVVFLAPSAAGTFALTDVLTPEAALVAASLLLVVALAVPVYRVHVLRRSAWAIELNRDLVEGAEPTQPT
ncbi:hypothetical protein [Nocardiopsis ganjiahuensis]|uniref:hypothetical protein n=1 Tax=Nocardiopsis ganjiahuensis TaxID=239984 RepID=UPI00034DD9BE|nr:hypothetical protein [Nocardiopsis ganjiahuensis]